MCVVTPGSAAVCGRPAVAILDGVVEVEEDDKRVGINWMQVIGAALAAVSSAVLLSTLGVAGTIIGAALGSVVASVGGAFYTRTLDASRGQVAAQAAALKRVTLARARVDAAMRRGGNVSETGLRSASRELSEAEEALDEAQHPERPGEGHSAEPEEAAADPSTWASRLPWKRIALIAAGVFVVAMVAISAFELVAGRAVSELTGGSDSSKGSTVPGLAEGSGDRRREPSGRPTEGPTTASDGPTSEPSGVSTPPDPTVTPTPTTEPSITPEPTAPTETPTTTPSEAPTTTPSPTTS